MSVTVTTNEVGEVTSSTAMCGGSIDGTYEGDYAPIVDHILENKFQLYNRSRQKIVSDAKITENIQPFSLFEDEKQTDSGTYKQFVLTSFTWKPMSEILEVELMEYDNTSDISLIEM